jgi:hypothetical protein
LADFPVGISLYFDFLHGIRELLTASEQSVPEVISVDFLGFAVVDEKLRGLVGLVAGVSCPTTFHLADLHLYCPMHPIIIIAVDLCLLVTEVLTFLWLIVWRGIVMNLDKINEIRAI